MGAAMSIDATGLPIGGGLALGVALYGAVAFFVAAPVIGGRIIERSNWDAQCQALIGAQLELERPEPVFTPKLDCHSTLGQLFPGMEAVCRKHGNPQFKLPMLDQLNELQRRKNELQEKRLALSVSQSASQCSCAVSLTIERNRTPLALYAGSVRLVASASIKDDLKHELVVALNSPRCTAKGGRS